MRRIDYTLVTFPELETLLSKPDDEQYWSIVRLYSHPDLLDEVCPNQLCQTIMKSTPKNISLYRATMIALKRHRYHKSKRVSELTRHKQQFIKAMTMLAKTLPEFAVLMSIPGFAETTTVLLIGELGDIRRFSSSNKLNAFIGIDLRHYESGEFVAAGHISKRGDTFARKLLFRAISNIATTAHY